MTLAHQFERIVEGGDGHRPHRHGRPHRDRLHAGRPGAPHPVPAFEHRRLPAAPGRHEAVAASTRSPSTSRARACHERLVLRTGRRRRPAGEKFAATDLVRSTWSAAIQHGAPVSALLVRALERCEPRDDTRLSRVMVDLLGPVPAEGDLWVRAESGALRQADRIGQRRDARAGTGRRAPTGRAGQRMAVADASTPPASCMRRRRRCDRSPRRESRDMKKDWDRNYVHSLDWRWLTDAAERRPRRVVDQARGRPRQGRDA